MIMYAHCGVVYELLAVTIILLLQLTWSSRVFCEVLQLEYEGEEFINYIPDAMKVRLLKVKGSTLDCSSSYAFLIGIMYLVPTLIS